MRQFCGSYACQLADSTRGQQNCQQTAILFCVLRVVATTEQSTRTIVGMSRATDWLTLTHGDSANQNADVADVAMAILQDTTENRGIAEHNSAQTVSEPESGGLMEKLDALGSPVLGRPEYSQTGLGAPEKSFGEPPLQTTATSTIRLPLMAN